MPLKCSQCQNEIPAGNAVCHHCGYKPKIVEKQIAKTWESSGTNIFKFLFIAAFVIAAIGIINAYFLARDTGVNVFETENGLIQVSCTQSADCQVPMEYAVRSNCPYQAYCADLQCVVGCPMPTAAVNTNTWQVGCKLDKDCDCSGWDAEGKYECKCLDQVCAAVLEVIK